MTPSLQLFLSILCAQEMVWHLQFNPLSLFFLKTCFFFLKISLDCEWEKYWPAPLLPLNPNLAPFAWGLQHMWRQCKIFSSCPSLTWPFGKRFLSFLGVVPFVRDRESKSFQSILRLPLDKDLHLSHLMQLFGCPYARLILTIWIGKGYFWHGM